MGTGLDPHSLVGRWGSQRVLRGQRQLGSLGPGSSRSPQERALGSGGQGWKEVMAHGAHVLENVIHVWWGIQSNSVGVCHGRRKCQGAPAGPGDSSPGKPRLVLKASALSHTFICLVDGYLLSTNPVPGTFLGGRYQHDGNRQCL